MTAWRRRAALALGLAAGGASAGPAEPPPAGFDGPTWIDSRGCAYQRARIGDDVVWADRLTADGEPLCGMTPSLSALSPSDGAPAIPVHRRGGTPAFPAPGIYAQVGAFTGKAKADALVTALQGAGFGVLRQDFPRSGGTLRVIYAGPLGDAAGAAAGLNRIRALGYPDAFIWTQD